MNIESLKKRQNELVVSLLEKRNPDGFWEGRLSSSALGVAVAVTAFHFNDKTKHQESIKKGICWLIGNQNRDGGFGDTPESLSNISTSLLVYAAFNIQDDSIIGLLQAKESLAKYLNSKSLDVNAATVADAILAHYKTDYTFSVPILTMCALCGIPSGNAFRKIPQLPFELALLPRSFYKALNLSVVSYAIPALIAVGIAIFINKRKKNPFTGWLRKKAIAPALRLLQTLMPESGGFLEAIPLTGFVGTCLMASGHQHLEVVEKGIRFLQNTQREDGSWAIDIDLSTWVTTLSVKALQQSVSNTPNNADRKIHADIIIADESEAGEPLWCHGEQEKLTSHLLRQQYTTVHPFNGAKPGGWGWTNNSGSVPDGDDTPGAIIALLLLNGNEPQKIKSAAIAGCNWLLNLQNNDGGFPTFVRGWGKLPFDQSCADLTGHGLLALSMTLDVFINDLSSFQNKKYMKAIRHGITYLRKHQKPNGVLLPLWFGNQLAAGHLNPVYGTARVLTYLSDITDLPALPQSVKEQLSIIIEKGLHYLCNAQNTDGSWGGDTGVAGTIEETALALGAIAGKKNQDACEKALDWLDRQYNTFGLIASPIGLYFASLWYDEVLYPQTTYLEGLSRFLNKML